MFISFSKFVIDIKASSVIIESQNQKQKTIFLNYESFRTKTAISKSYKLEKLKIFPTNLFMIAANGVNNWRSIRTSLIEIGHNLKEFREGKQRR